LLRERTLEGERQPIPAIDLFTQRIAASGGEFAEPGAAIVLRCAPTRLEQAVTDEAKQAGIERACSINSALPEICPMRRRTPYPCRGPSETALRMRRSRVPGRS
jgi:hypothetical protein